MLTALCSELLAMKADKILRELTALTLPILVPTFGVLSSWSPSWETGAASGAGSAANQRICVGKPFLAAVQGVSKSAWDPKAGLVVLAPQAASRLRAANAATLRIAMLLTSFCILNWTQNRIISLLGHRPLKLALKFSIEIVDVLTDTTAKSASETSYLWTLDPFWEACDLFVLIYYSSTRWLISSTDTPWAVDPFPMPLTLLWWIRQESH